MTQSGMRPYNYRGALGTSVLTTTDTTSLIPSGGLASFNNCVTYDASSAQNTTTYNAARLRPQDANR